MFIVADLVSLKYHLSQAYSFKIVCFAAITHLLLCRHGSLSELCSFLAGTNTRSDVSMVVTSMSMLSFDDFLLLGTQLTSLIESD